jgi:hypothetical protein
MGGLGSGGHNSKGKLRDVQCVRLDVHELTRDGNLKLGSRGLLFGTVYFEVAAPAHHAFRPSAAPSSLPQPPARCSDLRRSTLPRFCRSRRGSAGHLCCDAKPAILTPVITGLGVRPMRRRARSRVALGEPINQLEISLLIGGICCVLQDQWGY